MNNNINLPKEIKVFLIKHCKLPVFVLVILPFIIAVFNSYFFPKHFSLLIKYMMSSDITNITSVVKLIIAATLALQLFRYVQNKVLYAFLIRLNQKVKTVAMDYFSALSMEVDVITYGEKVNTLAQQIVDFLQISFSLMYKSIVSIFVSVTVLLLNNHFLIKIFVIFFVVFSFTLYNAVNNMVKQSEVLEKQLVTNKLYVNDVARNFFFEKLFSLQQTTLRIFHRNLDQETEALYNKYYALTYGTLICNGLVAITSCTIMFLNAVSNKDPMIKVMTFQVVNKFFMEMNDFANMVIPLLNNFGAIKEQYTYFKKPIPMLDNKKAYVQEDNINITKIEMFNVSYHYNNRVVINDFSYKFESPGIYIINGESGKGKSTLSQIIAGIRKPTTGEIIYNDDPYLEPIGKVNYMTQSSGIYNRTVRENIFLEGKQNIPDSMIKDMGMWNLLDREAGINGQNLSGGQIRRINLLRMLNSYRPGNLLIFDEPFIELDEELMDKIQNIIVSYADNIVIAVDHTKTLYNHIRSIDGLKVVNINI